MKVGISNLEGTPLLKLDGDVDHSNCGTLEKALEAVIGPQTQAVLLDLESVDYIDSGGLSVILATLRQLRGRGWLGAIAPNGNVTRLLEIVGLLVDPDFRLFADRDEAKTYLAKAAG